MTYTDAFNKLDSLFESVCNNYDYYCMFEAAGDEKQDSGAAKKFISSAVTILKKFIATIRSLVASITFKIKTFTSKFGPEEVIIPVEIEVCSGLVKMDYKILSDIKSYIDGVLSGSLDYSESIQYGDKIEREICDLSKKIKVVNFKFNTKKVLKYLSQVEKLSAHMQNKLKIFEDLNADEIAKAILSQDPDNFGPANDPTLERRLARMKKIKVITQFGKFLNVLSSDISRLINIAKGRSLGADNKEEPQQESVELENNALSAKLLIEAANLLAKSGENKDTIDVEFNW